MNDVIEWDATADLGAPQDIPDLTLGVDTSCGATHESGWGCTRLDGHTGRHAAGTGCRIAAVWR